MSTKVLIIGLDGATFDIINPLLQQGLLPTIQKLIDAGTSCTLNSTIPPMSPSAWTSFMTGKNPGKHGIFDFTQRDYRNYKTLITSRSQEPTLWGILSHYNQNVCIINVPQTYPPEKVNGIMIAGLGTPAHHKFTYPEHEASDLLRNGYKVNSDVRYKPNKEEEFLQAVFDTNDVLISESIRLMQKKQWDLSMVVLRITDEVPHFFWRYMDKDHPRYEEHGVPSYARNAITECYKKADASIAKLLEATNPDTVILVSDHGFGPLYKDVYLNSWLLRNGFLTLKTSSTIGKNIHSLLAGVGITRTNIGPMLSRIKLGWFRALLRTILGKNVNFIPNDNRQHLDTIVDWNKTCAYSIGYIGQIYINVKGRDPNGIVSTGDDYNHLCEKITRHLLEWKNDDDDLPVVDKVILKKDILHGKHIDNAPDIFVVMRNYSFITRESYDWSINRDIFSDPPTGENATHRLEGILIAAGKGVRQSGWQKEANIIDVAPTILHLMNQPIPNDMDGHVLLHILDLSDETLLPQQSDPIITEKDPHLALSAEEEELVEQRLRSLGYIE